MFDRSDRRESDWRRAIAARGASLSKARLVRRASWIEGASVIPTNPKQSTSHMRLRHSDTRLGRAAFGRPTGGNRVGWEGTVP